MVTIDKVILCILAPVAAVAFCIIVIATTGCASLNAAKDAGIIARREKSLAEPPSPYCQSLDTQHRWWSTGAIFMGGLSGVSGLGMIEVSKDDLHYTRDRNILVGTTVVFAAAGLAMQTMNSNVSQTWVKECAQ
jgi:hypothetical protein